ncbi:TMM81 protein, partial [Geococcyx californianus]|nr:TMM81 protein [Geococcyx californianus]
METLRNSLILRILPCAFYLPLLASVGNFTIPAELKTAVVKVAVRSTSCSVTCGVGFKLEEMCELTPFGGRRNCTLRRTECLTKWVCGIHYFTVPVGKAFQISCLTSDTGSFGNQAYNWGFARGIITTKDELFKPFENTNSFIKFSPIREADAGTYRCDVQMSKTFRMIKRIYFGLRVARNDLVELNFQKSLTWEQKLETNKKEGSTESSTREKEQKQRRFWREELIYECLVGAGSGVLAGVLVSVALCCLKKILRR